MDHGGEYDDAEMATSHDEYDEYDEQDSDMATDHEDLHDDQHGDEHDKQDPDEGSDDSASGSDDIGPDDAVAASATSTPPAAMHCAPGPTDAIAPAPVLAAAPAPDYAVSPASYSVPASAPAPPPGPLLPAAAAVQPPGAVVPPGAVAPIPGTQSGYGTPTSFDGAGHPTHVTYSGVVNPPQTTVTVGGNSPLYDAAGHSMVPTPPANDPTHVTLNYVPQQIPRTDAPPPALDPYSPAGQVRTRLQGQLNQTNTDINTNTVTGVSVDRSGGTPTYYGNGKPFDNYGDALGEERHPTR